jgi:glycosyltransferase involved in cell wall biosynthesis
MPASPIAGRSWARASSPRDAARHRTTRFLGSVSVLDVETTEPLERIGFARPGSSALVLLRRRGFPVGWVHIDAAVVADRERLLEQIRDEIRRHRATVPGEVLPVDVSLSTLCELPAISVVVCTRDRPQSLDLCLRSLVDLDYPRFEIIVVDNASQDTATMEIAARFPVRYVREETPGLDWARNRGIREASYDIIGFTDDDVRVDAQWLRSLARAFGDAEVSAVTGLVAPAELETEAQWYFEIVYGGMGKGLLPKRFSLESVSSEEVIGVQAIGVGANMAFRRSVFCDVGDFDTALDIGTAAFGAGDLEMFNRVLIAGRVLRYEPSAIVWHVHRREIRALRRQLYADGRSFGVYLIKLWRERPELRGIVAQYLATRWVPWLGGRLILGLLGRHQLPLRLLWANLWGATHAPWAYRVTTRQNRRLRSARTAR